jgi:hypothetical protein
MSLTMFVILCRDELASNIACLWFGTDTRVEEIY